jgi:hypothetical protein
MVWRIIGYDGLEEIFEQRIPLTDADEAKISAMLKTLAAQHLTPDEIAAGLADVSQDTTTSNRIMLTAGENPNYVASLWRSDELPKVE